MHGLVTCEHKWLFLRWTGSRDKPVLERAGLYICTFEDGMKVEEQVLKKIIGVLLLQMGDQHVGKKIKM